MGYNFTKLIYFSQDYSKKVDLGEIYTQKEKEKIQNGDISILLGGHSFEPILYIIFTDT